MAIRDGSYLYYLLGDHLGSTAITARGDDLRWQIVVITQCQPLEGIGKWATCVFQLLGDANISSLAE